MEPHARLSGKRRMTEIAERVYRSLLVVRCQAGDRAAFEELVELYQPRLFYFLSKMVGDRDDAEDLQQEVWFDVYRGLAKLANPAAFVVWLYQIARHKALRAVRRRGPTVVSLEGIELAQEDDTDDDFSAEDAQLIHEGLEKLAPEQREVLLLRFAEGMTYEEIARVTGCQLGTVRSRLYYAKRALRRIVEATAQHE
jgi:RNA polymerase sigma-70 factor (ECF subfamily)